MKSKIAIPNNRSSWLFNQKAERNQMNRQKSKSTIRATLLALILGVAGFLGSPAWAAEPPIDPATGKLLGFSSQEAKNAEPEYGGTVTAISNFGGQFPPTTFNPSSSIWTQYIYVSPYLETLLTGDIVKKGPRGTNEYGFSLSPAPPSSVVTGELAESWSMPDALTQVFKLRQGIMWQDKPGVMKAREFTAEDVVFAYKHKVSVFVEGGGEFQIVMDNIKSISAPDRYTVKIELNYVANPDWHYLWGLGGLSRIYPKEMVDAGMDDWRNGVGTGPFMIEDYVKGSHVSYVRNPNYWDTYTHKGKEYEIPFIDRMVKALMQDESAKIAALRTGKLDWHKMEKKDVPSLKKSSPELIIKDDYLQHWAYMLAMRTDREPFDDLLVRRAMNMAVDRQAILNTVFGGEGVLLNNPIPADGPESVFTPLEKMPKEVQENFEYNPERAKLLLAAAGYPEGFTTTLQAAALSPFQDMAEIIMANLRDIGIDVKAQMVDSTTTDALMSKKEHAPMLLFGHSVFPMYGALWRYAKLEDRGNAGMLNDPGINALFTYGERFTSDTAERLRLMKTMAIEGLKRASNVDLPSGYYAVAWWPWLENYYGEVEPSTADNKAPLWARAWINSKLKAKIQ